MATKIQLRRDTASDWTSTNPTMAAGEFGWESDTNRFKIGDGSTAWTSLGYASEGDTAGITFVGDDSTGTTVNQNETVKIAGATGITTAVSGDTLTVTGPDLSSYITASSSDTLTNKAGNISQWTNDSGYTTNTGTVTATSTDTFTNKTIDANGTGNSITNLDIDNMTAAVIVTESEGIGSNDNDTTIPTSAAVKAYADSVGGGGGASLGDLTAVGSTLLAPSNGDLNLETSGTGQVQIKARGGEFSNFSTSANYDNANILLYEDLSDTVGDGVRHYGNQLLENIKLSGSQNSSNSNDRWRQQATLNFDLNGSSSTATSAQYRSRGPMAFEGWTKISNSTATASTLGQASAGNYGISISPNGDGDITITNTTGMGQYLEIVQGAGDIAITDHVAYESIGIDSYGSGGSTTLTDLYHFRAGANTGSATITNNYGFYVEADAVATNQYAFYDASNSLSVFGDVQTQAVSITDNLITTNRSNDNLLIEANGTGYVAMGNDTQGFSTNESYGVTRVHKETVDASAISTGDHQKRANTTKAIYTLSGSGTNSNAIFQQGLADTLLDMSGYSSTGASSFDDLGAGASNRVLTTLSNNGGSASTLSEGHGLFNQLDLFSFGGSTLTVSNVVGCSSYVSAYPNTTVTNAYGMRVYANVPDFGAGPGTMTNYYGFYIHDTGNNATNQYGFYDATNSLSVFGDIQTQAVSITDNSISTNRSNDNLYISANGTGRVNMGDVKLEDAAYWSNVFGNPSRIKGTALTYEDLAVNPNDLTDRELGHAIYMGTKITADSSNSNFRPRAALIGSAVELDGFDYTNTSLFRGPLGAQIYGSVSNGTNTDAEIKTIRGVETSASVLDFSSTSGDITVVNAIGNMASNYHDRNGTGDINITNDIGFRFSPDAYNASGGTGVTTITNSYGFQVSANTGNATITNAYAFYSEDATASSRMGAIRLDNQSGDPTHGADFSWIFAKDESSSSEVFVKDEAGNVTKISPHNAAGEWEYYSRNTKTGKTVRVNMEAMIRDIEGLTGNTYIESE